MEQRVTLAELGSTAAELKAQGIEVGPDWKGRPSVALDDAARWFEERQAWQAERSRLRSEVPA